MGDCEKAKERITLKIKRHVLTAEPGIPDEGLQCAPHDRVTVKIEENDAYEEAGITGSADDLVNDNSEDDADDADDCWEPQATPKKRKKKMPSVSATKSPKKNK